MKTMKLARLLSVMVIGILFATTTAQAQEKDCPQHKKHQYKMQHKHCEKQGTYHDGQGLFGMLENLPDITEDQIKEIKSLHMKQAKEMMTYKNQLEEKKARLNTLTTADKPDMNAINAVADEISSIKNKMMKDKLAMQQEIRKVLNEEQRLIFDMHHSHMKDRGHGPHHGPCKK